MHLSKRHTWCLAAAMLPMVCTAQSLQEAVMIALTEYPSISAAKYKAEAAQADVVRAKGPHWPQLTWSGTYNDYRSSSLANRWVQSPTLSLNLWSGGRIQSDVERSEALAKASQKQQSITRDDVALLSSEGYLQWAHHQKMVMLAEENLSTHEKILSDFEKITQVDPGRRIDLNQALVRYENAKIILLKSETELAAAALRVSRMLTAPTPDQATGLDFVPTIPHSTLAEALDSLNDQHPVIGNLLAQRDAALASVRYAQAQNAPTVNLVHTKVTTPGLADGQYVTQLQLNLPLFDGGSARGAVGVAQAKQPGGNRTTADPDRQSIGLWLWPAVSRWSPFFAGLVEYTERLVHLPKQCRDGHTRIPDCAGTDHGDPRPVGQRLRSSECHTRGQVSHPTHCGTDGNNPKPRI